MDISKKVFFFVVYFFNLYFCALTVQATSEVGSAGLYLEDYFEEQLKLVYPDRLFPGGREEQMIPPLEDEIDEEEEMMDEGMAPIEDDKPQSPAGQGIPPVEEDLPPLEEAPVEEEEKSETEEKAVDTSEKGTEEKVPAAEEVQQDEESPVKEVESSPAADGETKVTEVAPSSPKEENSQLPTDTTVDPPESVEKESAPAEKQEEG